MKKSGGKVGPSHGSGSDSEGDPCYESYASKKKKAVSSKVQLLLPRKTSRDVAAVSGPRIATPPIAPSLPTTATSTPDPKKRQKRRRPTNQNKSHQLLCDRIPSGSSILSPHSSSSSRPALPRSSSSSHSHSSHTSTGSSNGGNPVTLTPTGTAARGPKRTSLPPKSRSKQGSSNSIANSTSNLSNWNNANDSNNSNSNSTMATAADTTKVEPGKLAALLPPSLSGSSPSVSTATYTSTKVTPPSEKTPLLGTDKKSPTQPKEAATAMMMALPPKVPKRKGAPSGGKKKGKGSRAVNNTSSSDEDQARTNSIDSGSHSTTGAAGGGSGGGRSSTDGVSSDGRQHSVTTSTSGEFHAEDVWGDTEQAPKDFMEIVYVFFYSVKRRSGWSTVLSLLYHTIHVAIILSFLFSPMLMRSVTFSAPSMSRSLLQAQGVIGLKQLGAGGSNAKGDDLVKSSAAAARRSPYGVESIWALHDKNFFLTPGLAVTTVDIAESFQKLDKRKKNDKNKGGNSNGGQNNKKEAGSSASGGDDEAADDSTNEHTYITKDQKAADERDAAEAAAQSVAAAGGSSKNVYKVISAPPRPVSSRKGGKAKDASLGRIAAAWEASPLYSSPLALTLYYYFYCIVSVIFLCVGSEGRLTGHFSLIRVCFCFGELMWYIHHGAHSFLIYTWLAALSHWPSAKMAAEDLRFLDKGTPYLRIHKADGAAQFHWYYNVASARDGMNGVPLRDVAMDSNVFLYNRADEFYHIALAVDFVFVFTLVMCVVWDLQRVLDSLMGVRDLWEPDGFMRCPLCGEVLDLPEAPWRRGLWDFIAAPLLAVVHPSESSRWLRCHDRMSAQNAAATAGATATITTVHHEEENDKIAFYENAGKSLRETASLGASIMTDSSEEDDNVGGIVKVIVRPLAPTATTTTTDATAVAGPLGYTPVPGPDDAVAPSEGSKRSRHITSVAKNFKNEKTQQKLYLHHTTRHVHHRCPKLFLDVDTSEEEEEEDTDETEESDSGAEEETDLPNAIATLSASGVIASARARSPPRRVPDVAMPPAFQKTGEETPPLLNGLESIDHLMAQNFSFNMNYGTMETVEKRQTHVVDRGTLDAMKDAEDEFRPGNAFPSYETANWLSKATYSWLNPLMNFALLEPTLLRHERFLPSLPKHLTAFDNVSVSAWQLWVHRKLWFGHLASKTGDALIPTEEALDRAEEALDLAEVQLQHGDDEETEETASSDNQTVVILGQKRLNNSKFRTQKPKREWTERLLLTLSAPLRWALRKAFFSFYIGRSHTIQRSRERLVRALLKDRLLTLHEEAGGSAESFEECVWTFADVASSSDGSSLNSAGSVLPTHMRRHLALRDVSLFHLFMEHRCGRRFLYNAGPLLLLYDVCSLSVVPIIGNIARQIATQPQYKDGWMGTKADEFGLIGGLNSAVWWCVALFVALAAQGLAYQGYWSQVSESVLEARTALRTIVLEKIMALPLAQRTFSETEVVNLVTVEANRLGSTLLTLHHAWSNPVYMLAVVGYLYYFMGLFQAVVCFVGIIVLVPSMRHMEARYRLAEHNTPSITPRITLITEALTCIRQVKAMLMESIYARKIWEQRAREREGERTVVKAEGWAGVTAEAGIGFLTLGTFVAHFYVGGSFEPGLLLPVLAALALLWTPLMEFPSLFSGVARGYLSLKRAEAFMRQSPDVFSGTWVDLTRQDIKKPYRRGSVVCKGCSFTWQHDLTQELPDPVLLEVHMRILPGELTMIQGPLGSGKSSLLLAILGEVNRCVDMDDLPRRERNFDDNVSEFSIVSHSTTDSRINYYGTPEEEMFSSRHTQSVPQHPVDCESDEDEIRATDGFLVFGSCVYCSDTPWLQNDTIRANVTTGGVPSPGKWYRTVIEACALDKDFKGLPDGDLTVVGDKGTQLTLSQKVRVGLARALYAKADIYLFDSVLTPLDEPTRRHLVHEVFHKMLRNKTVILVSNVGLAALQPHRIFTVTEEGMVREDTTMYRALPSDRDSVTSEETRQSVASEEGEHVDGHGAEGAAFSSEDEPLTPRVPYLYAEEFEEAVPVEEDLAISVSESTSCPLSFMDSKDVSDVGSVTPDEDTVAGDDEDDIGQSDDEEEGRKSYNQGLHHTLDEGKSFRQFVAFMGMQGLWLFLAIGAQQMLHLSMDVWIAYWLAIARWRTALSTASAFLLLFFLLAIASSLFVVPRTQLRFHTVYGTVHRIYQQAVESVLRAPASFFDSRTTSSVLHILTKDMEVASTNIPESLDIILGTSLQLGCVILFNAIINPAFLLILPIVVLLTLRVTHRFMIVSREVQRLESRSVSSTTAILREVLQGAPLVRCLSLQDRFREEYCRSLDTTNSATMIAYMAERWVCLRLQFVVAIMATTAALLGTVFSTSLATPSFVGVAIITCLRTGRVLTTMCRRVGVFRTQWLAMQGLLDLLFVKSETLVRKGQADLHTYQAASRSGKGAFVDYEDVTHAPLFTLVQTPQTGPQAAPVPPKDGRQPLKGRQPGSSTSTTTTASRHRSNSSHSSGVPITCPALELIHISACYRPGQPRALSNVNLSIYQGERVGIVGHTGHGKSTIFNVLLRLMDVVEGQVHVLGEDAERVPYPILRSQFATIPQDPLILNDTWRTNLLLGFYSGGVNQSAAAALQLPQSLSPPPDLALPPAAPMEDESFVRASPTSRNRRNANRFLSTSGSGYSNSWHRGSARNTPGLGATNPRKEADKALWEALDVVGLGYLAEISGGLDEPITDDGHIDDALTVTQRQMLCMARALLHKPPFLLIDDTAISGGDGQTDVVMQRLLSHHFRDSTVLLIAHRMSTVLQLCTRVVVVANGTIESVVDGGGAAMMPKLSPSMGPLTKESLQPIASFIE